MNTHIYYRTAAAALRVAGKRANSTSVTCDCGQSHAYEKNGIYHVYCAACANYYRPQGGKRKGAGQPAKQPTTTLSFRVPTKKATYYKALVKNILAK